MKKILCLVLSLCILASFLVVPTFAAKEGVLTYEIANGKATIIDCYSSASGAITIPSTLGGYPVTTIGISAFSLCTSITSVTIPDGVTSISYRAFYSCDSLTSVTIPDSVTSIGDEAFFGCDNLTSVTIGNGVTSIGDEAFFGCDNLTSVTIGNSVTSIGYRTFYECESLTSVTIPDSVTTIGYEAFSSCKSLTSVTIPDSVTSIGVEAFYRCESLTSVTIGNSVTTIGVRAFSLCKSLTSVTIPDSVTSIGVEAFYGCESLTSVTIPDSVTSIGDEAFCGCYKLTSVTIPDSVTSIGDWAFHYCTSLTSVTIPDSVTTIGDNAFDYCDSLTSVTIPDSVTSIGDAAFYRCKSLTNIKVANSNKYYSSVNGNLFNKNKTRLIQYASGKTDTFYVIPDSVTSIGDYAFYRCKSLTSVTIGNGVTSIGYSAFSGCSSLTSVAIPDSVTSIGVEAFSWCTSLTSVTIGNSVTTIGVEAFYYCYSLTSVTIGNSVTSIGREAFYGCGSLTSVTIPDSVTSIGEEAFSCCYSLTSVTIPDSVTSIGDEAFSHCTRLTSVTIPDSVTSIGEEAFYGCSSLTDVYYSGSESRWNKISIGRYNDELLNATIHFYLGYEEDNGDDESYEKPDFNPEYMPESINEVTITGKGTAYGRFLIKNSDGSIAKNKSVSYSIDGSALKTVKTNAYGYAIIEIPNISQSRTYKIAFSGSGIKESQGELKVTVKPLSYTSEYEAAVLAGGSLGLGFGVGGSIGKLEGEAKLAEITAEGSNEGTLSIKQEFSDNKNKLTVTTKRNADIAAEAKAGLFGKAGMGEVSGVKLSAADVSGKGSYGSFWGISYEDDNFSLKNGDDVINLSKFMLASVLESCGSNVATRYIISLIDAPISSRQKGSTASLSAGASFGTLSVGSNGYKEKLTLAGFGGNAVWQNSSITLKDNSKKYSSSISSEAGVDFLSYKASYEDDDTSHGTGFSVLSGEAGNEIEFEALRDKLGNLSYLSMSTSKDTSSNVGWNKYSTNQKSSLKFSDTTAQNIVSSNNALKQFSTGNKGFFSLPQAGKSVDAMFASNEVGYYSSTIENSRGFDFDFNAGVQLFLEIGVKIGLSGIEKYEYETENGIYDKGLYLQAKNNIASEVADAHVTVPEIMNSVHSAIGDFLEGCWDTVTSAVVNAAVSVGNAVVEGVKNTGKKIISVTKSIFGIKSAQVLAVSDEMALFSVSSVATTIGEPYIVSVTDENGNTLESFADDPLRITLSYTDLLLAEAGVSDVSNIAILRWDADKNVYVKMGGVHNASGKSVSLEITEPGQYILAVDDCPPAITVFKASDGGNSPEISAIVSDMSGISDFTFTLDGSKVVTMSNLSTYYNFTTGKFAYPAKDLSSGEHTATIYAKDSFGNYITESITFETDDSVPEISSVTPLSETIAPGEIISATVSGENILSVFLNAEICDPYGNTSTRSAKMELSDGVYSAPAFDIPAGYTVAYYVSAYNTAGNGASSTTQTVLSVPDTDAPSVFATLVTTTAIKARLLNAQAENAKVYFIVYSENGKVLQVDVKNAADEMVFRNISTQGAKCQIFVWNGDLNPIGKPAIIDLSAAEPLLYADVNKDGEINSFDVLILKYITIGRIKLTEYISVAGDVNGDGSITSEDSELVQFYLVEKIVSFPVENQ